MLKELTNRKKKILFALVETYISTGQPVSSADIQKKYLPDVSSATVRAELSALEALGFIDQPHTSAGRIPLKSAYKFYAEEIGTSQEQMITDAESAFIYKEFSKKLYEVEDVSKQAAKVISDLTNYTSFCVDHRVENIVIDEVKLVPLKQGKVVVLIITDQGMISNKVIDVNENLRTEYIDTANKVLNDVFQGKSLADIKDAESEIDEQFVEFKDIFLHVLGIIKTYIKSKSENVFVEGALKMLDYPDYSNLEDAKNILSLISDENSVKELVDGEEDAKIEYSVRIGKEDKGVDKCAIITAQYKIGDDLVAKAGVIGPERMDYKKVIGVLEFMKTTLKSAIDNKKEEK